MRGSPSGGTEGGEKATFCNSTVLGEAKGRLKAASETSHVENEKPQEHAEKVKSDRKE